MIGERSGVRHEIISVVRTKKLLKKGCYAYLTHVVLIDDAPVSVENVKVNRLFLTFLLMICLDCRQIATWSSPLIVTKY